MTIGCAKCQTPYVDAKPICTCGAPPAYVRDRDDDCRECLGRGYIPIDPESVAGPWGSSTCLPCNGTGKRIGLGTR